MDRMTPGQLMKYMVGGATALLLLWIGSIVVSQLMVAILPLLFLILGLGVWWSMMFGRRR